MARRVTVIRTNDSAKTVTTVRHLQLDVHLVTFQAPIFPVQLIEVAPSEISTKPPLLPWHESVCMKC